MKKSESLKDWSKILKRPTVVAWYNENLKGESQGKTIKSLELGISSGKLTTYEALCIALIVGVQWNINFERRPD